MADLFWTGPGVVGIGSKEYGADEALPVDKIDEKVLERWKKAGKVGEKISIVANDPRDAKITELEGVIVEAKTGAGEAEKHIGTCEAKIIELDGVIAEAEARKEAHAEERSTKIKDLAEANIGLTAKLGELKGALLGLPADAKKLKAAVEKLKAKLEEGNETP